VEGRSTPFKIQILGAGYNPIYRICTGRQATPLLGLPFPMLRRNTRPKRSQTISGANLDPANNPYFAKSVNDALGQAKSAFAGQYGGAAGGNLGNSGYQEGLARTLGNVATNAYSGQYNQNLQNQQQAAITAPSVAFANPSALAGIGGQQEAQQLAAYNSPWSNLQNLQGVLNSSNGYGTTNSQSPYYTNPLATAMGAGLGGLALYNGLGAAGLLGTTAASGGTAAGLATLAAL